MIEISVIDKIKIKFGGWNNCALLQNIQILIPNKIYHLYVYV